MLAHLHTALISTQHLLISTQHLLISTQRCLLAHLHTALAHLHTTLAHLHTALYACSSPHRTRHMIWASSSWASGGVRCLWHSTLISTSSDASRLWWFLRCDCTMCNILIWPSVAFLIWPSVALPQCLFLTCDDCTMCDCTTCNVIIWPSMTFLIWSSLIFAPTFVSSTVPISDVWRLHYVRLCYV